MPADSISLKSVFTGFFLCVILRKAENKNKQSGQDRLFKKEGVMKKKKFSQSVICFDVYSISTVCEVRVEEIWKACKKIMNKL